MGGFAHTLPSCADCHTAGGRCVASSNWCGAHPNVSATCSWGTAADRCTAPRCVLVFPFFMSGCNPCILTGQNVVVVTHGGLLSCVSQECGRRGLPVCRGGFVNGSVSQVLVEGSKFVPHSWNDVVHLGAEGGGAQGGGAEGG